MSYRREESPMPFILHHTDASGKSRLRVTWTSDFSRAEWLLLESAPEGTWVIEQRDIPSMTKVWLQRDNGLVRHGTIQDLSVWIRTEEVYELTLDSARSKYQLMAEDPFA